MALRVLHLIDSSGVYGAETMLLGLVEAQQAHGIEGEIGSIAAATDSKRPLEEACDRLGLPWRRIRISPAANFFAAAMALKEIEQSDVKLLHAHGYKADIVFGMALGRVRRIPILTTVHGWTETSRFSKMGAYQFLDRMSWRWMDAVVAVSDCSPVYQQGGCVRSKAVTIENGIGMIEKSLSVKNSRQYARIQHHCAGRPCIGMLTRLSREKGIDTMLSALLQLRAEGQDYALVILGDGPDLEAIAKRIKVESLGSSVLLAGYMESASQFLPFFDMLAIPSLTEGLPMVLLEAMATKVPVIATRVGQIPEVLNEGSCGLLFDPQDSMALASGIRKLIEDDVYRGALIDRASTRVLKKYGVTQMARSYSQVYSGLISKNSVSGEE